MYIHTHISSYIPHVCVHVKFCICKCIDRGDPAVRDNWLGVLILRCRLYSNGILTNYRCSATVIEASGEEHCLQILGQCG